MYDVGICRVVAIMSKDNIATIETSDPAGRILVITVVVNDQNNHIGYTVKTKREGMRLTENWAFKTVNSLPKVYTPSKHEVIIDAIINSLRFRSNSVVL